MRLTTAVRDFIRDSRISLSGATLDKYEAILDDFLASAKTHGSDNVLSFTPDAVGEFFRDPRRQRMAPATLRCARAALATFARWGLRKRLWSSDPMVDAPRIPRPHHLPRPFAPDQRRRLLALDLPLVERLLRTLLDETGVRVSELCALRVGDVALGESDESPGWLRVTGKGRKTRMVPLLPTARAVLFEWIATKTNLEPGSPLLRQADGSPWTPAMIERRCRAWGKPAGVERCHPHRFRHTLATRLLERCGDLRVVQEILGHASVATTEVYTHVTSTRLQAAVMGLAEAVSLPVSRRGEEDAG